MYGSRCSAGFESRCRRLVAEEEDPNLAPHRDLGLARDTREPISIGHGMKHRRALIPGETHDVSRIGLGQDHPQIGGAVILIANRLGGYSCDFRVE